MIALNLTDIKNFMNLLLKSEMFDHFLLAEATITQGASYTIDGHINPSSYTQEELEEQQLTGLSVLPFSVLRPVCFQLIRGKKTPSAFKFVFMLSPNNLENTLSRSESGQTVLDVNGMFINLTYQNGQLTLTTGISYATFVAGHTLEHEWDTIIRKFLTKYAVNYEEF